MSRLRDHAWRSKYHSDAGSLVEQFYEPALPPVCMMRRGPAFRSFPIPVPIPHPYPYPHALSPIPLPFPPSMVLAKSSTDGEAFAREGNRKREEGWG